MIRDINKVGASRGAEWISCGWKLFKSNIGLWLLISLAFLALNILLSLVPIIGPFVSTLLTPALVAGFLHGASLVAKGESLQFADLFKAFRSERINGLLILGVAQFSLSILAGLILLSAMGPSVMEAMRSGGASVSHSMGDVPLLGLLATSLLLALFSMAMLYAPALVYFHGVPATDALLTSFKASFTNIGALSVFGLILFGLGILAAMTFGLGFIVLLPVVMCAVYCSFREMFESPKPVGGVMQV